MQSTNALRMKMKLNRKPTKAGMKAHIKTNLRLNGSVYRKRYNTFTVPTIILPFDPIALAERLHILMESKAAENTGV